MKRIFTHCATCACVKSENSRSESQRELLLVSLDSLAEMEGDEGGGEATPLGHVGGRI